MTRLLIVEAMKYPYYLKIVAANSFIQLLRNSCTWWCRRVGARGVCSPLAVSPPKYQFFSAPLAVHESLVRGTQTNWFFYEVRCAEDRLH